MGLLTLLLSNPLLFLVLAIVLLYSVILHEVAHGWVAHLYGDNTALNSGRLTLNPLSHLDPLGALMLFLVGFGWAKPVPVAYYKLKYSRLALFSVSLAGCAMNIVLAILALFLLQFDFVNSNQAYSAVLSIVVRINIILGAFNLIPLPPLDGSKIVMSFLSRDIQASFMKLEPYGLVILAVLLFTGLLNPIINIMQNIIFNFIIVIFSFNK